MISPELDGGCLCGAVRYRVSQAPATAILCHCRNCQKQSGAAFSVNLIVSRNAIAVRGEMATFLDHGDSKRPLHRRFCAVCGSHIMTEPLENPEFLFLKAGTLDDISQIAPTAQYWCGSAQPWLKLDPDLQSFPDNG